MPNENQARHRFRKGGTHCFRQCTRPIHSAHTCRTFASKPPDCRNTPGVRRRSAAKRGHSPESPPSAACCLPGTKTHHRWCDHCKSPDRAGNYVACRPSALSLPLNRVITPKTDGTRLPCRDTNNRHGKAGSCFRPSSESPHMLPHVFYSGHSPSLRHTPPAIADRYLMTNQVAGSANFRTPQ